MKHPIHQGQAVERIIRSKGYAVTEFARLANVNRRFLLVWFSQPVLKPHVLQILGNVLDQDFSTEFADTNPVQRPFRKIIVRRLSESCLTA